jgi:branched-chain amino acid transport system substrate-binding protein
VSLLAVLALSGCGSRQSHAALEAALRGAGTSTITTTGDSTTTTGGGTTTTGGGTTSTGGGTTAAPGGTTTTTGGNSSSTGAGTTATTGGATSPVSGGSAPAGGGRTKTGGGTTSSGGTTGGHVASGNSLVPGVQSGCAKQLAPVNIGSVGEQSGLAGAAVAAGAQTVSAWAAYVNSLGGLRCHPLKYITADDGGDPSRNSSLTQQLVQQDGVVAFVYNDAPLAANGSLNYLVQHKIPIIGNEGAEQFMYQHPMFFPQAPNGNSLVYTSFGGMAPMLTASQRQHLGMIYCLEAAECSIYGKLGAVDAKKAGLKLIYSASASLTAPDYTSQCLRAKQAGVTALFVVLDPNSIHRAAANCRNAGYQGQFVVGSTIVVPDEASDPNLNGMVFGAPQKPWVTLSNPQVRLMNQVLAKYAPGVSPVGSSGLGWTAAQLFAYSSTFWPSTNTITSADIINAMDRVKNYDVGGMTGPMTFTKGRNAPEVTCWFQMALRGGKFISPNNGARSCLRGNPPS